MTHPLGIYAGLSFCVAKPHVPGDYELDAGDMDGNGLIRKGHNEKENPDGDNLYSTVGGDFECIIQEV